MPIIKGPFDVDMQPLDAHASSSDDTELGRMSIDKTYSGAMTGVSKGEMLMAMTATPGSAGYVAIEQFTGSIDGRAGGLVLQHFGIMHDGSERLTLEVVPQSGTGDLAGITGTMKIEHEGGRQYVFDCQFVDSETVSK